MKKSRATMLSGLALALGVTLPVVTSSAQTTTYPQPGRPITILVPFAPGGPSDIGTRILVPFLEKELGAGTTIQIVNKPGATTQLANTELARSKPDGYTLEVVPPPS